MTEETSYIWVPPPELVADSNLTAFLRATGQADYDALAARAEADPAWLMEEVFRFCDVRFYRRYDQMLDVSPRRAMGAMVRRRHHQYRPELHRQASRYAGVGPDLSGLGGRRPPRAAPADLSRTRPRGRTPCAGVAQARYRPAATWSRSICRICRKHLSRFSQILKLGAIVMPLFSGFGPSPIQSRLNHGEPRWSLQRMALGAAAYLRR